MSNTDETSILGLNWNRSADTLSIKFKDEEENSFVTLCAALSALHAVFDPLNLCAPCILKLKLFVQECWKIKATWEQPLPSSMEAEYRKLIVEREDIKEIVFHRYLWSTSSDEGTYELHCFTDASKVAYGCCLYLVHKTKGKANHVSFSRN